ncbi:glycosyltransferase family 4 protein [Nocardia colli]|uniref:Glycosyltransferase family 4 protein n=1 Tax=Nocardia colli TaxID=2545717 RepID=A0A5N0DVI3_9NOCA|nr:glycosyltransferase family 4 protein [Nocardia colli]KAA8880646.1 glycosyltransferase family 4 protein [Nocardia colli]
MEAAKWIAGFRSLGATVIRAAGHFNDHESDDVVVAGMWANTAGGFPPKVDAAIVAHLCETNDVLVLDNAVTLWSAPEAAMVWERAAVESSMPTIVRHHDPPWQCLPLRPIPPGVVPVVNPRFLHVVLNQLSYVQYAERWPRLVRSRALQVSANRVDTVGLIKGDRAYTRKRLGVDGDALLVLHPARMIERKNIPAAVRIARSLTVFGRPVHYWLTDPSDAPPGSLSEAALRDAPGAIRGYVDDRADMYAAADVVVLPSTWEGWGLPVIEAAAARKLIIAGPYPVLTEIRATGLIVLDPIDIPTIIEVLRSPERLDSILDNNATVVERHFNLDDLSTILTGFVDEATRLANS